MGVLKSSVMALEASLVECAESKEREVKRLKGLCEWHLSRAEGAEGDAARFYAELEKAIKIPDISSLVGGRVLVDPWNMTPIQWRGVQPVLISDDGYYAFTEEEWLRILAPIQAEVKKKLGFPKNEINNCDNWTLTMCALVAIAFRDAGLDKQGAFLKLVSKPHSYCGFMMPDYTVRVYEPLSGEVVGRLGETGPGDYGSGTYRTEQAFFLA